MNTVTIITESGLSVEVNAEYRMEYVENWAQAVPVIKTVTIGGITLTRDEIGDNLLDKVFDEVCREKDLTL